MTIEQLVLMMVDLLNEKGEGEIFHVTENEIRIGFRENAFIITVTE